MVHLGAGGVCFLPYWNQDMEFDIEMWVPYRCDFNPITTNTLFSDLLGRIAELAMSMESELLYMWNGADYPVGTLVPENLIHPRLSGDDERGFAMVFSYSREMERALHDINRGSDLFGAGITTCCIRRSSILLEECKVLAVASDNPLFDPEEFLDSLGRTLSDRRRPRSGNLPYFAERFGYRRFSIPFETDNVMDLRISSTIMSFEFEETRRCVGPVKEISL
ncbi:MAG: hypothetical protein LBS75_06135 [Synergistaceae bacterium]|jgi:hypothetical protein|nr:hypothetical protein [Synergistaceae bacterium]